MGIKKIFIDSNIFLNVLLEEDKSYDASVRLLEHIENGKFIATTTLMNIMEILFVLRKVCREIRDEELLETVGKLFEIENLDIVVPNEFHILEAYDFQRTLKLHPNDAIFVSVAKNEADAIVTRDEKMKKESSGIITCVEPEEL